VPEGEDVSAFEDEPAHHTTDDHDGTDNLNHWMTVNA
jgi:hypothetical protein